MRVVAPFDVACASICGIVQYSVRALPRETTSPLSSISRSTSSAQSAPPARCGSGGGSCTGASTRCASSNASGVTQAEIDVRNDLPRNGPSGTYSHDWMSRALQSFTSTTPNTCSANSSVVTGPRAGTPTTKPSSSSTSSFRVGSYTGSASPSLSSPHGRTTSVPLTATVPARP